MTRRKQNPAFRSPTSKDPVGERLDTALMLRSSAELQKIFERAIKRAPEGTFAGPLHLICDDATALQGRDPKGRGHACASLENDGTGYVYIAWKLVEPLTPLKRKALLERQEGVIFHELGHLSLLAQARAAQAGADATYDLGAALEDHSEQDADDEAERLFGKRIRYDKDGVQTTGPGDYPRPLALDAPRANPGCPSCVIVTNPTSRDGRLLENPGAKPRWEIWFDPSNNSYTLCGAGDHERCGDSAVSELLHTFEAEDYEAAKKIYEKRLFDSPEPIENPGAWNMKRIHALFGYPDGKIPLDAEDERIYRGVKVKLRKSKSGAAVCAACEGSGLAPGSVYYGDATCPSCHGRGTRGGTRGGKGHRIVVDCPCGQTVGFGRMVAHALGGSSNVSLGVDAPGGCDFARQTFFSPKKICNCATCVKEQRELDESECPNKCKHCGTHLEWDPNFAGHNYKSMGRLRAGNGQPLFTQGSWVDDQQSDFCHYKRTNGTHESQVFGLEPPVVEDPSSREADDGRLLENPESAVTTLLNNTGAVDDIMQALSRIVTQGTWEEHGSTPFFCKDEVTAFVDYCIEALRSAPHVEPDREITKEVALTLKPGDHLYHYRERTATGAPLRARVSGKTETWKREPEAFRVPIRMGMTRTGAVCGGEFVRATGMGFTYSGHEWRLTEAEALKKRVTVDDVSAFWWSPLGRDGGLRAGLRLVRQKIYVLQDTFTGSRRMEQIAETTAANFEPACLDEWRAAAGWEEHSIPETRRRDNFPADTVGQRFDFVGATPPWGMVHTEGCAIHRTIPHMRRCTCGALGGAPIENPSRRSRATRTRTRNPAPAAVRLKDFPPVPEDLRRYAFDFLEPLSFPDRHGPSQRDLPKHLRTDLGVPRRDGFPQYMPTLEDCAFAVELLDAVYRALPDDVNARYGVTVPSSAPHSVGPGNVVLVGAFMNDWHGPQLTCAATRDDTHAECVRITASLPNKGESGLGVKVKSKGTAAAMRDLFLAAGWVPIRGSKNQFGPPPSLIQSMGLRPTLFQRNSDPDLGTFCFDRVETFEPCRYCGAQLWWTSPTGRLTDGQWIDSSNSGACSIRDKHEPLARPTKNPAPRTKRATR